MVKTGISDTLSYAATSQVYPRMKALASLDGCRVIFLGARLLQEQLL